MNFKLELVIIPVTDVDRAKAFYERGDFVLDHDHVVNNDVRFGQFTPPESACSIALGTGLTDAPVGEAAGRRRRRRGGVRGAAATRVGSERRQGVPRQS